MSDYGSTNPPPPPPPPSYGGGASQGAPPPNYLVWSILSVFLCWPLAIASIVFSTQVNSKRAMGDAAGSLDASSKAKKFAIWAGAVGAAGWLLYILFFVVLVAAGTTTTTN